MNKFDLCFLIIITLHLIVFIFYAFKLFIYIFTFNLLYIYIYIFIFILNWVYVPAVSPQTIKIQIMNMVDHLFCNLQKLCPKICFGLDWNYVNL